MSSFPLRLVAGLSVAAVTSSAASADAVPAPGAHVVSARVSDADDRSFDLASAVGRPTLVVYEDRDSIQLNAGLKAELGRLAARDPRYRTALATIAVADVRGFSYWPVKGFVKDAVRSESKKRGTPIYCDWDGHFGQALALQRGTSNVLLYSRSGTLLFGKSGKLSPVEVQQVVGLLKNELGS